MKKVGIVTLFGNYNYGNKFQNYAVLEIVKSYGFQADTLVFSQSRLKEYGRFLKRCLKWMKRDPEIKRYNTFANFSNKMLSVRKIYAKNGIVDTNIKNEYSYFCVGSDQVWNPEIRQKERDIFFLKFADKRQRVCVSPSIGVKKIDDIYFESFQSGLKGFPKLSCREEDGAKEIERISEKDCVQLLDPTLVLDANKWREFALQKPVYLNKKYLLCFFLGDFNPELKSIIKEYADLKNLNIIEPSSVEDDFYSCEPREMISLIDGAEMIFTDSFHFSAFSINLNKPFWVFDRFSTSNIANHINSRIISLVELFELRDRYTSIENLSLSKECDFSNANKIIKFEREKFDLFMRKCLEID